MALTASEQLSGGFVRDLSGRLVTVASAGGALAAGEQLSSGFVLDADGRLMTVASAGGVLTAGEQISGGFVRDPVGRLMVVTSGAVAYSGGYMRDQAGRLVTSSASGALGAGEAFSGGFVRDVNGLLSLAAATLSYNATVLADSPVAFWPLNETGGTVAVDATGNGHDGAYSGTFTLNQPGIGDGQGAVGMQSGTGRVTVPDSPVLKTAPLSVECWIYLTTMTGINNIAAVMAKQVGNSTGWYFEFFSTTPEYLWWTDTVSITSSAVAAGNWNYLVGTADGTTNTFYLNGSLQGSHAATLTPNTATLLIAGPQAPLNALNNAIVAKAAVYNGILSPTRIAAHYATVPH